MDVADHWLLDVVRRNYGNLDVVHFGDFSMGDMIVSVAIASIAPVAKAVDGGDEEEGGNESESDGGIHSD